MGFKTLTHNGQTKTIWQWSQITGLSRQCIYQRLKRQLPIDAVLDPELDVRGRHGSRSLEPTHTELRAFTAYREWMEAEHRALQRTIRAFVRDVEDRAAEARHRVDRMVQEQIDWAAREASRGEGSNVFSDRASDHMNPSAQEMTNLEKFR